MDVEEIIDPNDIENEDDGDGEQIHRPIESGNDVFDTPPPSEDEDENHQDQTNHNVVLHDNP